MTRIEEIEVELARHEYEAAIKPITSKMNKLDRERRLTMEPKFEELSDFGSLMSLKDFIENCKDGSFIDYDGSGRYVKDGKESNISIYPSDVKNKSIRTDFDQIIWFNR